MNDRGQTMTLEAITGALIMFSVLLFALQATAITPLTSSTANQLIEEQNRQLAGDILDVATDNGSLSRSVRLYNTTNETFENAPKANGGAYVQGGPNTAFGELLNETFRDKNTAFNVYVHYQDRQGTELVPASRRMVYQGEPSNNAISVSKLIVLYDDQPLTSDSDGTIANPTDGNFYVLDDINTGGPVYNLVRVEVVVWKI